MNQPKDIAKSRQKRRSLTAKQEQCVYLLSRGEMTRKAIAETVGVPVDTLDKWRRREDFQARLQELLAEYREGTTCLAIADVKQRLLSLQQRYDKLHRITEERAKAASQDVDLRGVPGMTTGLLVPRQHVVGKGADQHILPEYNLDASLLSEMRALELQAARELGQHRAPGEMTDTNPDAVEIHPESVKGYWHGSSADIVKRLMVQLENAHPVQPIAVVEVSVMEYIDQGCHESVSNWTHSHSTIHNNAAPMVSCGALGRPQERDDANTLDAPTLK